MTSITHPSRRVEPGRPRAAPEAAASPKPAANGARARAGALLVGPAAAGLKAADVGMPVRRVASLLEAVLVSGPETCAAIIADVAAESEQLERAIGTLRQVNPDARIVLLCGAADELACRRAQRWGANDYIVLPVRVAELRAALGPRRVTSPAETPAPRAVAGVTALPLAAHVRLTEAMLESPSDLPARAVALLNEHLEWPAPLRFVAVGVGEVPTGGVPVSHESMAGACGVLTFGSQVDAQLDAPTRLRVAEAAAWLAGYLALQRRAEQLRSLAITDELTGAYNRRYFNSFVSALLEKAREQLFRVSVLLFDIDNFKHYNDEHGHAAGDEILRQVIALLRRCTRPRDLVARIGGDEFAVVFWDAEPPRQPNSQHPRDALAVSARFRKAIEAHDWCKDCELTGSVTISGGIATFPWDASSLGTLLAKADDGLLRAKGQGKNVICLSERGAGE